MSGGACLPPPHLPGLDPSWSSLVSVVDADGTAHTWHVLDNAVADPELTLLCLHGNPTWSYLWRRLFAEAPSTWRVIAPDQLGMGYSDRLERPRTLAQRTADLSALTAALGVTGPTVTVAHDWGGVISLAWAAEHRDQLRGVVLTNTAVHLPDGTPGPVLIRLADLPVLRELSCVRTPTFVRAATALSRPALPADIRDAFAAPYSTADRRRSVGDFVADIPFAPDHPSRAAVDAIAEATRTLDVPALMLWGPRDPVFSQVYLDDLLTRLPHADVHRFEQASHLVTEDAPAYASAVVSWVADRGLVGTPSLPKSAEVQPATSAIDPAGSAIDSGSSVSDPAGSAIDPDSSAIGPLASPVGTGGAALSSLGQRLSDRAGDSGPAVVEVGKRAVSWDLLERRVREIAAGLAAIGVGRGDRVAMLVPPSVDLTAAVYAVWRAGAVIVVADKGLGIQGMGRALRGARVNYVIGTAAGLTASRAMRLPGVRIAVGSVPRALREALGVKHTLVGLARVGRSSSPPSAPLADDDCAVVFTSGATGPAKGVAYRHRQVEAQVELIRSTYALTGDDRIVAAFAPFSLYGPALGIGSAVPDMDVTSPGTLTAAALADAVLGIQATVVFASPAALRNVVATADAVSGVQLTALAGVRLLMSAGAPVPAMLLRAVGRVLPGAEAHTPYGMTEVLPVTDIDANGIEAAGAGEGVCVGLPLPEVLVGISEVTDAGVADGPPMDKPQVTGEVCVSAPHVKDRYDSLWATERASARDAGWHRTGDVGRLDEQGRLWIEGRLEHVIATASGVVTPVGIEQRVETLDEVQAAAAVGVGPAGTAQVVVVVVPRDRPARWRRSLVAPLELTDSVRRSAGVDVAAVLVAPDLPVDIRHNSKVDRRKVGAWAAVALAGESRTAPSW